MQHFTTTTTFRQHRLRRQYMMRLSYSSSFSLKFDGLLSVLIGRCDIIDRLSHVELNTINHLTLLSERERDMVLETHIQRHILTLILLFSRFFGFIVVVIKIKLKKSKELPRKDKIR